MWLLGVLEKRFPKKFTKKCLCYSLFLILSKSYRPSGLQLYWRDIPALGFQNQPFVDLLQNGCSWIIHKIHRKTLILELLFLRTPYFTEHLQWLLLKVSGFQPANFIIKETTAKMFFCEFCKIFKDIFSFDRAPQDDCFLCLSVNVEFFGTLLL